MVTESRVGFEDREERRETALRAVRVLSAVEAVVDQKVREGAATGVAGADVDVCHVTLAEMRGCGDWGLTSGVSGERSESTARRG